MDPSTEPLPPPPFTAELYVSDGGAYTEEDKVRACGVQTPDAQHLRLGPVTGARRLRLDLADRPGFVRMDALRLTCDGASVWAWEGDEAGWKALRDAPHHQVVMGEAPGCVLLAGDDPWIELPVSAAVMASGRLELEVVMAWPVTAEALGLAPAAGLAMATQGLRQQAEHAASLARQLAQARERVAADMLAARFAARKLVQDRAALRHRLDRLRPEPLVPAKVIDIVVPVYLNLEVTRQCIESVLRTPQRPAWRLVLVNDATPEPEVAQWLRDLAAVRPGDVLLLENAENLGYSGTVNRGIEASDAHDVVLLNSDAEVANDWLARLQAAAYTDLRVGTVTPFSNNATICSWPRFCEANLLPAGWDVGGLDREFATRNAGQHLDIPTAVGFCMYIRRDCVQEIGLFDMDLFGKGYGEENDFCMRAADAGWRNLHALDVFVAHIGGVSFGASKPVREQEAMVKLRTLYPDYEPLVHDYIRRDPAAAARERVARAIGMAAAPLRPPAEAAP